MRNAREKLGRMIMIVAALAVAFLAQPCAAAATATRASGQQENSNPFARDACLPITPLTDGEMFSSARKVFAHYFDRFPLSIDNKPWDRDYYTTQYLNPDGERGKWRDHGGFLRSRPLPVPVAGKDKDFVLENLKREVRMAMNVGITGFTYDILSMNDIGPQGRFMKMAQAAAEVDPRFKLVLMPDMASLGHSPDKMVAIVEALRNVENLYRLHDGRIVVAPFLSESVEPQQWENALNRLSQEGYHVAFVPTFLSLGDRYLNKYGPISQGMGTFGTPLPGRGEEVANYAAKLKNAGKISMAGISGQGYRPKSYLYWESQGSLAYTQSWLAAIRAQADWVQLTTWNDYSESTQIAPYTDASGSAGTVFYDLTAYYARWFLEGAPPPITRDVIYYLYRKEPVGADAPKAGKETRSSHAYIAGQDAIEILSFLVSPGKLVIKINDKSYTKEAEAGVSRFIAPLDKGIPHFSLERGGKTIISVAGRTPVVGKEGLSSGYLDLTYWGGSASAEGECGANQ